MKRMICDMGHEVIPVEGVTALFQRGYWWCAHHAKIDYLKGKALVDFPSPGKLSPKTIMTEIVGS